MLRFVLGVVLDCLLSILGSAFAAGVFGSGPLKDWTVTKDGEKVCSDPEVDTLEREIQCDTRT
jgi:hypothetical protein